MTPAAVERDVAPASDADAARIAALEHKVRELEAERAQSETEKREFEAAVEWLLEAWLAERDRRRRSDAVTAGALRMVITVDSKGVWRFRTITGEPAVPSLTRVALERLLVGVRGATPRER